jgi:hypothetical protein
MIVALALVGCGSDGSSPSPTAVDTAPPAVPSDLSGDTWQRQVVVNWAPNTTDADLAGYLVYRENGTRLASLTEEPQVQNWYVDAAPVTGENTYRVTAVDYSGNESAWSDVTVDVSGSPYGDEYHPDAP